MEPGEIEQPNGANRTPVAYCAGISKYFGGVRALSDVSLNLYAGEVTALVGDNGAGKSTLVNILSGIYPPDEGHIGLGATEVKSLNPRLARAFGIETVYQDLSLCDNLDAAANVMLGREPVRFRIGPFHFVDSKRSIQETRQRVSEVGADLQDFFTPVRRLSGGQRQAIAIARAIGRSCKVILLDEPTAALGVRQTKLTLELVRRIAGKGVSVIMISHNLDDVFAVADRIVALRLGRITLDAPLQSTSREEVVACMTGIAVRPAS